MARVKNLYYNINIRYYDIYNINIWYNNEWYPIYQWYLIHMFYIIFSIESTKFTSSVIFLFILINFNKIHIRNIYKYFYINEILFYDIYQ